MRFHTYKVINASRMSHFSSMTEPVLNQGKGSKSKAADTFSAFLVPPHSFRLKEETMGEEI